MSSTSTESTTLCPYCGRALLWMPSRWLGRGVFQCEQCGDFPDFRSGTAPETTRAAAAPKCRVLIVDDDEAHRELYAAMIGDATSVVTADGGERALALAMAQPFDVILLDVMMPVMDGPEMIRRMRADPALSQIPAILMTALPEAIPNGDAAQHDAVLVKPFSIAELLARC
jgi:CheY-like chemotaxis protein